MASVLARRETASVWFAYVDESYNDAQHWVVAVLIEHAHVNDAQRAIRAVVAEAADAYGIREEAELHGHQIFHGEGDFAPMKELVRARIGIYASVFRCLVDAGCSIVLRGVSKPHLTRRYAYPEHPHRVAMTHLIERVDEFVGPGDHALLIADEHHETQSTLLRDLIAYQEIGTWGYRGHRIGNVVDTIHFVRSATNWLVQGADLVAFLALRRATHAETDPRAQAANDALWGVVQPRIHHEWCWYP